MTTHDQQTENAYAPAQVRPTTSETDQLRDRGAPPAAVGGTDTTPKSAETDSGTALFADDELAGLRARWDNVQAGFVDDPRDCVHKADGLVSDVVDQLTAGFSRTRSRLEERWARGEEASTEDLRMALKGYRQFLERLLAV